MRVDHGLPPKSGCPKYRTYHIFPEKKAEVAPCGVDLIADRIAECYSEREQRRKRLDAHEGENNKMRCGNCGHKLTAAALAMGYCPQCSVELRSEHADGPTASGMIIVEEPQPEIAAPAKAPALPPPAAALPPPTRGSVPLADGLPSNQPPRASVPRPSLMNFPTPPPPAAKGAAPPAGNRPLAGHELAAPAPHANPPTNRAPTAGTNAPLFQPPQAPLIVTSSRSDVPSPPPPPPQALHHAPPMPQFQAAPPAYVPPPQRDGEPPHARAPKAAHIVDANPSPLVVDAGVPLTILPNAQRRSPLPAILGTVFILIAVALGGLFIAGNRGVGPLAAATHTTSTSSTVAQTASPTALPTETVTPAPTDTPVPPSPTPQPTVPPAPSGYTTYTSGDGVFGMNYPNDWTPPDANPTAQGAFTPYQFTSQTTSNENITIDRSNTTLTPSDIETYLGNYAVSSGAGSTFVITQHTATQTLGATTWMAAEGTYMSNGMEHKVIGLAANDGANGFLFFYDAPIGSFDAAPGSTYDTMVRSFTFLR
jgi:hypothetical protein